MSKGFHQAFGEGSDWDVAAHIRFLRAQGGASSGYTADLLTVMHLQMEKAALALAAADDHVARLREALEPFAAHAERYEPDELDGDCTAWDSTFTMGDIRRARAALASKEEPAR